MAAAERPSRGSPDAGSNAGRRASKEFRREQLINATIDTLARRGYAATTLADVADEAGLSRGIVNFHFESKEKLLIETLNVLSDEYTANWKQALSDAGPSAAARLRAMITSDLDLKVCSPRKVSAWFAFWGEAKNKPSYRELCWARDDDYIGVLQELCAELKREGGYAYDVERTAFAIYSAQEGLWLRLMIAVREFTRETALATALELLGALFPRHFEHDGTLRGRTA